MSYIFQQDDGSHMLPRAHRHEAPLRCTGLSSLQHVAWGETTNPATKPTTCSVSDVFFECLKSLDQMGLLEKPNLDFSIQL